MTNATEDSMANGDVDDVEEGVKEEEVEEDDGAQRNPSMARFLQLIVKGNVKGKALSILLFPNGCGISVILDNTTTRTAY